MADILQHRRGTSTEWTSANPVLADGEIGYETNTRKFKFGDGVTAWNSLDYTYELASQEIFSGTITVDFGATPTDSVEYVVTGLTNITTSANIQLWIQGNDTTADNTANDHETLAYYAHFIPDDIIAGVGFRAIVHLLAGEAVGTYKIHYSYTL